MLVTLFHLSRLKPPAIRLVQWQSWYRGPEKSKKSIPCYLPRTIGRKCKLKTCLTNNRQKTFVAENPRLEQFGSISLKCIFDMINWIISDFYIILGQPSLRALNMVTIHVTRMNSERTMAIYSQSVDELNKLGLDQFYRIGNFDRKYHIVIKKDSEPVVHAPRKFSMHK